jgi:DNA-binding beta-propeller fold protein YncE
MRSTHIRLAIRDNGLIFHCTDLTEFIHISDHENDQIYVINATTRQLEKTFSTGRLPRAIKISEDGEKLYVPVAAEGQLEIYETSTGKLLAQIDDLEGATDVILTEDGTKAVVTGMETNRVALVDLQTNEVTKVIDDLPGAKHLAFNRVQSRVYVTLSGSDEVAIIDMVSFILKGTIQVGPKPHGIEIKALPGIGGSCG